MKKNKFPENYPLAFHKSIYNLNPKYGRLHCIAVL
jgi:hypothetical protein